MDYIYSIEHLYEVFDNNVKKIEAYKNQHGEEFNEGFYITPKVFLTLLYYGLSREQIIALNLSDISADGIKGYDIDLDKPALDLLLRYRNSEGYVRGCGNGSGFMLYRQQTFIRTAKQGEVTIKTLANLFRKSNFPVIDFVVETVYLSGRFARLYRYGVEVGETFTERGKIGINKMLMYRDGILNATGFDYENTPRGNESLRRRLTAYSEYYPGKHQYEIEQSEKFAQEVKVEPPQEENKAEKLITEIYAKLRELETLIKGE